MPDVRLQVVGREFGGWKGITIRRGIDALAGGFAASVSERWNPDMDPWPIQEEDECVMLVAGDPVITGWIDKATFRIDGNDHAITFEGRDKPGALVDCSADLAQWEFHNITVLDLVTKLAAPFGVSVALQAGIDDKAISLKTTTKTGKALAGGSPQAGVAGKSSSMVIGKPQAKVTVNPGDSPFEVIDRACRLAGLLPVSDGGGGLILTRTGGVRATSALVLGENVLSAEVTRDATKKYRTYKVTGQTPGDDTSYGENAAAVIGTATDQNVQRSHRVLRIAAEGPVTNDFARQRAAWEATTRAARSEALSVTVQGWEQADGSLWPVNGLVEVRIPPLNINGEERLIVQTEMTLSSGGTFTTLELARPESYRPEPVLTPATSGGGMTVPAAFR